MIKKGLKNNRTGKEAPLETKGRLRNLQAARGSGRFFHCGGSRVYKQNHR